MQPTATVEPTAEPTAAPTAEAVAPQPKLDLADATKKYITGSAAAWAAKDPKKNSALYADGAVVAIPGPKGWEEVKATDMEKSLAGYFTAFSDLKMTYTRVVARGDMAVAEWVFTGTNDGDMMGQKATKKKVGYKGASVIWFANDGRVKRENVYFDMGTMMGQLGMGPKGQKVRPVEATPSAATEFLIAKDGEAATDALAKSWFATSMKSDGKALAALATDDIVMSAQYMPADIKGKAALEKNVAEGGKAFVDQKADVTGCVPVGDLTACEYTWTATWKGPAMGMKPTGKTGTVHSLAVVKTKDGKVAMATEFANGTEFAGSFGLMDEKAGGKPGAEPKGGAGGAGGAPAQAGAGAPKAGGTAAPSGGAAPASTAPKTSGGAAPASTTPSKPAGTAAPASTGKK
ncbi:MAG TPA: nuclear transport factor 2 family protein [Polyangiaceae bacterium]|nr:nuclear transport factor 2 family protein [Polyangiaceae bacterium]